ncbi:unnamed protein product, partial [Durusdinium trenchii]
KQTTGQWNHAGDNVTFMNDDKDFNVDYVETYDLPPNFCQRRILPDQLKDDSAEPWEGQRSYLQVAQWRGERVAVAEFALGLKMAVVLELHLASTI